MMTPKEHQIRGLSDSDLAIPCVVNFISINLFDLNCDILNKIFKYINDDLKLRLINEECKKIFTTRTFQETVFDNVVKSKFGKIDSLILLKQRGFPYDDKTFEIAVEYGDVEKVKWLKENGCPGWDKYLFNIGFNRFKKEIINKISNILIDSLENTFEYYVFPNYGYNLSIAFTFYEGSIQKYENIKYDIQIKRNVLYEYLYSDVADMIFYGDQYSGSTLSHNILHYLIENKCPGWEKYNMRITYLSNKVLVSSVLSRKKKCITCHFSSISDIKRIFLKMKNIRYIVN